MSSEAYRLANFEELLKTYHGDIRVGRIMEEMKFRAKLTEERRKEEMKEEAKWGWWWLKRKRGKLRGGKKRGLNRRRRTRRLTGCSPAARHRKYLP